MVKTGFRKEPEQNAKNSMRVLHWKFTLCWIEMIEGSNFA